MLLSCLCLFYIHLEEKFLNKVKKNVTIYDKMNDKIIIWACRIAIVAACCAVLNPGAMRPPVEMEQPWLLKNAK